jgi:hypothetical protein
MIAIFARNVRRSTMASSTERPCLSPDAGKLDALRTHKRGLMQQLFPSPENFSS